jgi:hypothetical protein
MIEKQEALTEKLGVLPDCVESALCATSVPYIW